MKALSIQQPWASLIVHGVKPVENRTWRTDFHGRVLIHAGKREDADAAECMRLGWHPVTGDVWEWPDIAFERGGIIGEAEIVDCVTRMDDPWFVGPYGFVIRNPRLLPFAPCRGQLGFFTPDYAHPDPRPTDFDLLGDPV